MSIETLPPVVQHERSSDFNERLVRDIALADRVQAGYQPARPTEENPHPVIIDGTLDKDASDALSTLWHAYERLAQSAVNRFAPQIDKTPNIDKADLMQEAFLAMYHSAVRWNSSSGLGFTTHYVPMLRNYIQRYADKQRSTVAIPTYRREQLRAVNRARWDLYETTEHVPTRQRLANRLGVHPRDIDNIVYEEALADQMGSLDGGYFEDDRDRHSTFGKRQDVWKPIDPAASEQQAIEEQFLLDDLRGIFDAVMSEGTGYHRISGLSDREIEVIRLRFLSISPMSKYEIAAQLGIVPTTVGNIIVKALAKLRTTAVSDYLHGYDQEA